MDLSDWIEFFAAAGVPPNVRKMYAEIFVEHRINRALLADLDKEHLKDMGINLVGDIISILKYCKKMKNEVSKSDTSTVTSTTTQSSKLKLGQDAPNLSTVGHSESQNMVTTTKRRVTPEMEGKYIVNMPKGTTAKTRRILAMIKQKNSRVEMPLKQRTKKNVSTIDFSKSIRMDDDANLCGSDEDDDDDDDDDDDAEDHYRVIITKPSQIGASKDSVFDRLGNKTCESPTMPHVTYSTDRNGSLTNVTQRIISRSLNQSSPSSHAMAKSFQTTQLQSASAGPRPGTKRTVNEMSSNDRFSSFDEVNELDYRGVLKRLQPTHSNVQAIETRRRQQQQQQQQLQSKVDFGQTRIKHPSAKSRLGHKLSGGPDKLLSPRSVHRRLGNMNFLT